ncbi:hypothetical protein [Actinopolymorpha alba]|uniref:hypothetical protein n=1 Tax=Actinopolymorpha alba TaxID=533267 RepID=UPI00037B6155|nr:hypothetical protein [Actinopolymorpha alba]
MVERIGKPSRIKNAQGDDCFQRYGYSAVELTMRCFARDPGIRRGAGRDLALASIRIRLGGKPLVLPDAIARRPIAAPLLQLVDAHRLLNDCGVEMIRDHHLVLKRTLDEASVRMVSADDGFVLEMSAGWRPRPGGRFYSEENETGVWVTGNPDRRNTSGS